MRIYYVVECVVDVLEIRIGGDVYARGVRGVGGGVRR